MILASASDDRAGPIRSIHRGWCLSVGATLIGWVLCVEERAVDAHEEDYLGRS